MIEVLVPRLLVMIWMAYHVLLVGLPVSSPPAPMTVISAVWLMLESVTPCTDKSEAVTVVFVNGAPEFGETDKPDLRELPTTTVATGGLTHAQKALDAPTGGVLPMLLS